jgi:hypothetical protein
VKNALVTFFCVLFLSVGAFAQESDSSYSEETNEIPSEVSEEEEEDEEIYRAPADSLRIEKRAFDEEKYRELKADKDLDYTQAPTVAESLWTRIKRWIGEFFKSLFSTAVETDWGRLLVYIIGIPLVIVLIMMLLKVNAFRVLFSAAGAPQKYQVLEENIHEMDFEKLLAESVQQQDYRRGVRLLFLYALKLLSDRELIRWESGKTNHDYLGEIAKGELKPGFNELSYYFDYAWYGNFIINRQTFDKAHNAFNDWKKKLS